MVIVDSEDLDCAETEAIGWTLLVLKTVAADLDCAEIEAISWTLLVLKTVAAEMEIVDLLR